MDFMALPDAGTLRLENLVTPACLTGAVGDLVSHCVTLTRGGPGEAVIDMRGRIALPAFTDMHTHLDKGHIWGRCPNPDGSFIGALDTVGTDREARWTAQDVRRRMEFSLRCAHAHGTRAIRTHLDSIAPQDDISWPVFAEMRDDWAGRIALQAVCLVPIDMVEEDGAFAHTADLVRTFGGVLGAVAFAVPDLDARLDTFLGMASARGLSVDFHVDETGDPAAAGLHAIAGAVLRTGFDRPVVVGHCCSLARQDVDAADRTMDLVAAAGLHVVSLPMCNMYLQDRLGGRTPRWRGITLVHEMAARGINVSFASDNTRDPFYAYGDMDMVEVMREATRIAHLDHSGDRWPAAFSTNPAAACGLGPAGANDLVIFNARNWTELFARPQGDRIVIRAGRAIDRTLPAYAELDDLMEPSP